MKLTSAQVQETLTQYDGQPIPDDVKEAIRVQARRLVHFAGKLAS